MNISQIENNQRVATGVLPMKYLNHYITDLAELRRITGKDWRETEVIEPKYDQSTHRLTETLVDGMLATEVIPAEEIAVAIALKRQNASAEVKQIRGETADKFTKRSSGVLMVYEVNVVAARAYLAGSTDLLRTGMTPEQHLMMGANMGMNAEQFAYYILSENARLGPSMWDVEDRYLAALMAVAYGAAESIDSIVSGYREWCATVNGN